jgi:anti-sigma regulatory factor (Ser/Thr protein kinase)
MPDYVVKLPATFAAFGRAAGELRRALEARGIGPKARYNAELVFEEIVSNIIRHGCSDHVQCAVEVTIRFDDDALRMNFQDNGPPFDPRTYELPELPRSPEAAMRGGLGLLLVNKASRRIDYEWTRQSKNHLTVTIALAEATSAAAG